MPVVSSVSSDRRIAATELRAFYELVLSGGGGIPLEVCGLVDDGRTCALECNVVRMGARWSWRRRRPTTSTRRPWVNARSPADAGVRRRDMRSAGARYGVPMWGARLRRGVARWWAAPALIAAVFVWPVAGALSSPETTSALRVEVSGPPQNVYASDGREHIEYDLMITDAFTATATLRSLEVRAGGRLLLSYDRAALGRPDAPVGTFKPTGGRVAPATTVSTQVDILLPRSAGRTLPRTLTNRISLLDSGQCSRAIHHRDDDREAAAGERRSPAADRDRVTAEGYRMAGRQRVLRRSVLAPPPDRAGDVERRLRHARDVCDRLGPSRARPAVQG